MSLQFAARRVFGAVGIRGRGGSGVLEGGAAGGVAVDGVAVDGSTPNWLASDDQGSDEDGSVIFCGHKMAMQRGQHRAKTPVYVLQICLQRRGSG
jgi:hypothetical protein